MVAEVVAGLRAGGVERVILGGVNPEEWRIQESLAKNYPEFVTPVMGIHPWTVRDTDDAELEIMFRLLEEKSSSLSILGEIGLDFHQDNSPAQKAKQTKWCERQLRLAAALNKPVVLHVVGGHDIMLRLLRDIHSLRGFIHGFAASPEVARCYLELGFSLSLGARFFQKNNAVDVTWLGPSDFVLESDAPSRKGPKTDHTDVVADWLSSLKSSANYLAELWNISAEGVWDLSDTNFCRQVGGKLKA